MSQRAPLVLNNGEVQQLQSGDVLATARTITAGLSITPQGGTAVNLTVGYVGNIYVFEAPGVFLGVDLAVLAANGPTGAAFILDLYKSSDQGTTWTSLWASNPGNRPSIAAAGTHGSTTSFDTTTFTAGDWLRCYVAQVGSTQGGHDITAAIKVATG